tara:strand:+ start:2023 stop:3171 length:1149 start_codon:yes stop_codon:yes gene_type:complete
MSYIDAPLGEFYKGLGISFYHVLSRKSVGFPAFITAFNETFNCDWNTETIYGRGDPIHTYKNTKRAITIGFKMPAGDELGAYSNLKTLQRFLQFLYPGYEKITDRIKDIGDAGNLPISVRQRAYQQLELPSERGIAHDMADSLLYAKYSMTSPTYTVAQSPLVRLKVMNLTQDNSQTAGETFSSFFANAGVWDPSRGLLGYIKNVAISHNLETDVGVIEGEGPPHGYAAVSILPKLIEVTVDFIAIHEHHLGWNPISSNRAKNIRSQDESRYEDAASDASVALTYAIEGDEDYAFHSPYGIKRGAYEKAFGARDYVDGENPWMKGGDYPTLESAIAKDVHNRNLLPDTNPGPYSYGPEPGSAAADAARAEAAAKASSVLKKK